MSLCWDEDNPWRQKKGIEGLDGLVRPKHVF